MFSTLGKIRLFLWIIMAIVFIWQVSSSWSKFRASLIGKTSATIDINTQWPSVTICIYKESNATLNNNLTFGQLLNLMPGQNKIFHEAAFNSYGENVTSIAIGNITTSPNRSLWSSWARIGSSGNLQFCYTFDVPFILNDGSYLQLRMNLSGTGSVRGPLVRIHPPGHDYGLLQVGIEQEETVLSFQADGIKTWMFEFTVGRMVFLKTDSSFCSDSLEKPEFGTCLELYIQKQIGCFGFPSRARDPSVTRQCSTSADLTNYMDVIRKMDLMTVKSAARATGCSTRCTTDRYTLSLYSTERPNVPGYSEISLFNAQTDVQIETEHYIYDVDNLIADVGGYLGLLLGASIMSFYDAVVHVANVAKSKLLGRQNNRHSATKE